MARSQQAWPDHGPDHPNWQRLTVASCTCGLPDLDKPVLADMLEPLTG